jgi:hypothetical protein
MENSQGISPQWVKMTLFSHLNAPTYSESEYAAEGVGLTKKRLLSRLTKGPVSNADYFLEAVRQKALPSFVSAPVDIDQSMVYMRESGLTGAYCQFETTENVDPYEWAGMKRIMATTRGNYVYKRAGLVYLSLAYTFYSCGIKADPQFIPLIAEMQKAEKSDIICPIAEVVKGKIPAFDILYHSGWRDDLMRIGREYRM